MEYLFISSSINYLSYIFNILIFFTELYCITFHIIIHHSFMVATIVFSILSFIRSINYYVIVIFYVFLFVIFNFMIII
jgi:hypothetical protein